MAVRSFQQILDAHEAAQAMLQSLEVDVRDTLLEANLELARFRTVISKFEWEVGSKFVVRYMGEGATEAGITKGTVYTLIANRRSILDDLHPLAFIDDDGDHRVFYSFWWSMVTPVA